MKSWSPHADRISTNFSWSVVHGRNLEKLAETDVPDAKRIVKKLGGSKLRSIFHGIWSL
jgi:hypothetical protein